MGGGAATPEAWPSHGLSPAKGTQEHPEGRVLSWLLTLQIYTSSAIFLIQGTYIKYHPEQYY